MKRTIVYLVRHAHADWRADESRPLSSRGRASASAIAERFGRLPIAAIYSSPSRRAVETVETLAQRLHIEPVLLEDLRERELAAPSAAEFEAAIAASWREPGRPAGGGESNNAAQGRGIALIQSVLKAHPARSIVISTHGSLLALILHGFDPTFGYDFWRSLTFPDAYELTFREQTLVSVGRTWHEDGE